MYSTLASKEFDMTGPTRRGATALISLVAALGVFMLALVASLSPAAADDGSRFLRLGLNKSAAIRLPAPAKDVLVGNPEIVDAVVRTRSTAYLFAKKAGQTNIFFFDESGRQLLNLDLEVAMDMEALKKLIDRTIPGNGITVDTVNDSVVLRGTAPDAGAAQQAYELAAQFTGEKEKVVSAIAVSAKEQVMLRVRVAEVQRDVLKQLGVDYNTAFSTGSFIAGQSQVLPFSLNDDLSSGALLPSNPISSLSRMGTRLTYGENFDGFIRAMENDGLLRTLAEPTLTAISGESAKFLAGGEFPIPVGIDNNQISIEFKKYGVALGYTPVVLSEGRISLKITTEVSELTQEGAIALNGFQIPGLKSRQAETTVELPSGGSLIMAGLIQDNARQAINGLPAMKNLPVLGQLFRSRDFQSRQTELTVMVTPFIVNPVNEKQLVSPIDKLSVATDRQTILFGRLNKVYGTSGAGTGKGSTYHGNVGFIVE